MKKLCILCLSWSLALPALAGVVYEMETREAGGSATQMNTLAAEGGNLKMTMAEGGAGPSEAIFRGDRRELLVIDRRDQSYMVLDEESMRQVGNAINSVMQQMEEALENVPESQRARMREMMKQRMPQQQADAAPRADVRKASERRTIEGYPCVRYDVLVDGRKTRELWVTPWDRVEGGREAMDAMRGMAEFMSAMLESMPPMGQSGIAENMFAEMEEIEGFPVLTRQLAEDGSLERESTLRSAERRTIDPSEFEPPAGYKRQAMPSFQQ